MLEYLDKIGPLFSFFFLCYS